MFEFGALLASSDFATIDWVIIVGYFALLMGIAWWVIKKGQDTADDYFLAGRNLGWFIIGASIFASNIGSEHLVGLAGSGASDGVAMAHYELHAWCLLVLGWVMVPFFMRSKVFTMPEFLEKRFTPTARWVLSLISLVAYVLTKVAVGIFAGGIVFSVLLPDMNFMGLDSFWLGSIMVIVLTGLYTILGGLRAVAYTEAIQTFILVIGSILVTIFGLQALGGWSELREICGSEMFNLWKPLVPETIDGVKAVGTWAPVDQVVTTDTGEKVHEIAWYFNSHYPWLSMLFCAPIIGLWYWCTDQYIVQRALGAPNEKEARRGSIFASFLKLLPVFIFIIPGMIAHALYTTNKLPGLAVDRYVSNEPIYLIDTLEGRQTQTLLDSEDLERIRRENPERLELALLDSTRLAPELEKNPDLLSGYEGKVDVYATLDTVKHWVTQEDPGPLADTIKRQNNRAFPLLVREILPQGIRGIVVAGLLAALMSSLAGVFNASATLFTMDFYSKLRPNTSQHQLVWIGRVATTVMVLIGLVWIPVIKGGKNLYDYLQGVQAYLAPPIFVVFFFGVFNKRLNANGCLAALIIGFILGLFRLAIDTPVMLFGQTYAEGSFFWIMNKMFFQYYSIIITLVCIIAMVVFSYLSPAPIREKIEGLTFGTLSEEHKAESRSSWKASDVILSVVLMVIIVAIYMYFRG